MKRKIIIEPFEEHEKVIFYTIRFDGEPSEFDKFYDQFDNDKHAEDIDLILLDIENIGIKGAFERDFRYEGKKRDSLCALPSYRATHCKLRIFCLLINEETVIIGNGYEKTARTYNKNPIAIRYADTLVSIEKLIQSRIRDDKIQLYQGKIFGNLTFTLENENSKEK